eukprot:12339711-Alexandrium_andersonii.AAC.1
MAEQAANMAPRVSQESLQAFVDSMRAHDQGSLGYKIQYGFGAAASGEIHATPEISERFHRALTNAWQS